MEEFYLLAYSMTNDKLIFCLLIFCDNLDKELDDCIGVYIF